MRFWVVYNKQLKEEEKDKYCPADWIMFLNPIRQGEMPPAGYDIMTVDEIKAYQDKLWYHYIDLQTDRANYMATRKLRISDLLAYEYRQFHESKIDFTSHLKSGVYLEKKEVNMTKSGRPVNIIYYYDNQKIAEIKFEFEMDSLNFITRRVRKLGYFAIDNNVHEYYVIEDTAFSGLIPYQHQKRLEERTQARQWIIDSLKSDVDRMLTLSAQQNPTLAAALSAMINSFWVEYNPHLAAFISAGGTYLRSKFQNDTTYPFLNSVVAPNITARMYIVDKLTY